MKRAIPILVLSSALLTGCGSYTDPGYSYTNVSPNETSVRAKIIAGARAGRWDVCDLDENSLRLTKDFKKYQVGIIAAYSEENNAYELELIPELTTLTDENGKVHPKMNKILRKVDRTIQKSSSANANINSDLIKCSYVSTYRPSSGSLLFRNNTSTELTWIGEPTKIPFNSKFKVVALRDSTKVPDVFVKSIEERLSDALVEQGRYTPTEKAFTIEIHLSQFDSSTKGAAVDFMIGTGDQKMKARAIFKDPSGKEICYVDIYTRLFTGGLAFIAKASNKVTLLIKEAVMGHLEKDILE